MQEASKQPNDAVEQKQQTEPPEEGKKVSKAKFDKLQEEFEKASSDRDHWKNEYYKAYADMMNLRKALEEEKNSAIRYRAEGFLETLLPALDSFHMALESPAPNPESRNYQIGFSYIYNQIVASLSNEGVSEICPEPGDAYDVNTMHAVDKIPTTDYPEGTVARVGAKGYKLHDRLVRAAMVYVAEAPKSSDESKTQPSENEAKAHEA